MRLLRTAGVLAGVLALVSLSAAAASASPAHHALSGPVPAVTCGDKGDIVTGFGNSEYEAGSYLLDSSDTENGVVNLSDSGDGTSPTNYCWVDTGYGNGSAGELIQYGTNWCLAYNASLGELVVQTCNAQSYQQWYFTFEGYKDTGGTIQDYYAIGTPYNGDVMDAIANNLPVEVTPYAGAEYQLWLTVLAS